MPPAEQFEILGTAGMKLAERPQGTAPFLLAMQ
jgi:hypothetical protein